MKQIKCCKLGFLQWGLNPKYWLTFLFLGFNMWNCFHGLRAYAAYLGYPMRPWLLVTLPGMKDYFVIIMLAFVLLVSDAPFRSRQQQFVLQRIGKAKWIQGQLLYLLLASVIFTVVLWLLSWVFFLPEVEWRNSWGPVIQTAAQTGSHSSYAPVPISYEIIKNATPLEANAWCFFMMIAVCFLLGEIITLCNLWGKGGLGTAIVIGLIMLSYLLRLLSYTVGAYRFFLWVSPLSWIDRSMMGHTNQNLPSFAYGAYMAAGLCLLLGGVIIGTIHRCNLETDKE